MIQSRLDYLRGDRCTVSYSLQNHSYLWRRRFKICLISVFGISGTLHCHLEAVTTPSHTLAATPCLWAREKPWRRGTAASSTTGSPSRSCWLTAPGHLTGKKYTTLCCLWPQCDGKRERMFWWGGRLYHTPELIQLWCVRRRAQPHTTLAGRDKPTAIGAMKGPRLWTCSFCPKLEIIYRQILSETITGENTAILVFPQKGYWITEELFSLQGSLNSSFWEGKYQTQTSVLCLNTSFHSRTL